MKRITITLTVDDDWISSDKVRNIKHSGADKAVLIVSEERLSFASVEVKVGNVRKKST